MGNLLAYSGLTTKVKAMQSHLLTASQFQEMANLESVTAAVEYLKRQPAYEEVFSGTEPGELHRGAIEQLLIGSEYHDFAKLYRFSNLSQRKFLNLYFGHYEVAVIKRCLRSLIGQYPLELDLYAFQNFFERHSSLNIARLLEAKSLPEFTSALEDSSFFPLLSHLSREENLSLFDYENSLDMFYFNTMCKTISKKLKPDDRKILIQCFGSRLDMLNIQWIYRSKYYYHMAPADIYAMLIPIQYRLKTSDIHKMTESESMDSFFSAFHETRYGKDPEIAQVSQPHPEAVANLVNQHIYQYTSRKDPYSIAILNSYLYFKEQEIRRIITIIESIRYKIDPQKILDSVMNPLKGGLAS